MRRRKEESTGHALIEALEATEPLVPGSYAFVLGHLVGRLPDVVIPELYDLASTREAPKSARILAANIAHDFKALQGTGQ